MTLTDFDVLLNDTPDEKRRFEDLLDRLDDFQVIILYDREPNNFDYNYLVNFPTDSLKRKIENNSIFPRIKSETFIVTDSKYQDNFDLFYKLRVNARQQMQTKITEFMTAKFFSANESYLTPLLDNKPMLKWEILNSLFAKYETMLNENTQLNTDSAWVGLSDMFKPYLQNHAVEGLIDSHGQSYLESLENELLNDLFIRQMNADFKSDDGFLDNFTKAVNVYVKKWISELLITFEVEKDSMKGINELLNIAAPTGVLPQFRATVRSNHFTVMSNPVYQFITETMSNRKFVICDDDAWPTATIQSNMLGGYVELRPNEDQRTGCVTNAQEAAAGITEADVDIMDVLCHLYLTRCTPGIDQAEIRIDELLESRGLKTKLGGAGRRGGYEKEQREQVMKALSIIQLLYIKMDHVLVYEQGKPVKKPVQGRAFLFTHTDGSPYSFTADDTCETFTLTVGEAFTDFLTGSTRQVKLLPNQAIEYNPYQRKWEKKLIRYLSWRWRTQARKASYLQPHKISTLLEKLDVDTASQAPSRIRDRFEKALDLLEEEGVIAFWQYENWDESTMSKKGWLRIWQEATIIIAPSDDVIKYYQPIERKKTINSPTNFSLAQNKEAVCKNIGSDFKETRVNRGLTLKQVSEELRISTSYISNIERGGALPSQNVYKKMKEWLN